MKNYEEFAIEMMESFYHMTNAASGVPMDGITDKGGIVDHHQIWKPAELRRVNAYIGAILRGQTLEPDALVTDLRVRLHVIGLDFEPFSIEGEDGRYIVQCSHYKGIGWNTKTADVEEFETAVGENLYMVLDYWTNDEGYIQMSGKLVGEPDIEEYMDDEVEDDDLQEACECEMDDDDEEDDELEESVQPKKSIADMTKVMHSAKEYSILKQWDGNVAVVFDGDFVNPVKLPDSYLKTSTFKKMKQVDPETYKTKQIK